MLEGITHIFQVPLGWFRAVDAKCFHFTPGRMLALSENDQGGDVLGVDEEAFAAAVRDVVGGSGGGGFTGDLEVVADVKWTGTQLQKVARTLSFEGGALKSAGAATTSVVDTPTVITWS